MHSPTALTLIQHSCSTAVHCVHRAERRLVRNSCSRCEILAAVSNSVAKSDCASIASANFVSRFSCLLSLLDTFTTLYILDFNRDTVRCLPFNCCFLLQRLQHSTSKLRQPPVCAVTAARCYGANRSKGKRSVTAAAQATTKEPASSTSIAAKSGSDSNNQIQVEVEQRPKWNIHLTVTVPANYCKRAWKRAIDEARNEFKVDGFRDSSKVSNNIAVSNSSRAPWPVVMKYVKEATKPD